MTEGFEDFDAEGQKRKIFLDVVGFLGDTPALNGSLDVLGHTSTACCHLCKFTRGSQSELGSRYARSGCNGSITAFKRSFYQHTAVRDSSAESEAFRLLGMKPSRETDVLPLHSLRQAIWNARDRIPISVSGFPILPGHLDPYHASIVAPNHLLTSHAKDCINLAFKFLPSRLSRLSCEAHMIKFLSDAKLPSQNRLFDHEKKQLFSMSMTDTYALSLVAELGFLKGSANVDAQESERAEISEKCLSAIALVGSCSQLIADLWFLPEKYYDGPGSVSNLILILDLPAFESCRIKSKSTLAT